VTKTNTNRKHMTGDHHGRTARRATLLVRATDGILGTHNRNASKQLADALRAEIEAGAYPPGSKIPSYRQLRDIHHVALNTAQAAIRMLAAEGLVEIRPAQGAYVRDPQERSNPTLRTELADLQTVLRRSRHDLTTAEKALAGLLARLPAEEEPR
jgi:DNA-binding FadR family transcriptional regulator